MPRDALSIVGRAGLRAGGSKIAVAHVGEAAAQLNGIPDARWLLDRIVQDVISGRKARAFFIKQDQTPHRRLSRLSWKLRWRSLT